MVCVIVGIKKSNFTSKVVVQKFSLGKLFPFLTFLCAVRGSSDGRFFLLEKQGCVVKIMIRMRIFATFCRFLVGETIFFTASNQ